MVPIFWLMTFGIATRDSAVLAVLSEAVLVTDATGRVVDCNPAAEALFGYPCALLVGQIAGGPPGRSSEQDFTAVRAHVAAHGRWEADVVFRRPDGTRRVCQSTTVALGDTDGYVVLSRDVTADRAKEVQLAEAELRWRLTIDNAPVGMALVALDGTWLRVNGALCSMLGYTEVQLLTLSFQEITHPEDLSADLELVGQLVNGDIASYTLEKRFIHAHGREIAAQVSVALVNNEFGEPLHFVCHIEDVTERRRDARRLALVIASAHDAFVTIDGLQRVCDWNLAAERMFGWSRQEATGRSLAELISPVGAESGASCDLRTFCAEASDEPAERVEVTARHRDGTSRPVEVTAWRSEEGAGAFYHLFLRDISDRVLATTLAREVAARQTAILDAQLDVAQVELTPSKVMQRICEQAQSLTQADGAVVEMREGDEMVYRAVTGSLLPYLGLRLDVSTSISGRCATEEQSLVCYDTDIDFRVDREACRRLGVRSMLLSPLRHNNQVVGVLKVTSSEAARFSAADQEVLDFLAAPFGSAMANAWSLERASRQAMTDTLTHLGNRDYALHELRRTLKRQTRRGGHTAVAFLDLDGFKQVNDTYGHASGNLLLREVGARLLAAVRSTDAAARYGGDEFIVVCELTSPADAEALAARLVRAVPGRYDFSDFSAEIGASIGIAVASAPIHAEMLLLAADQAMYEVKHSGGNAWKIDRVA